MGKGRKKKPKSLKRGALPTAALLEEAFFKYVLNPKPGVCPVRGCTQASHQNRSLCARHNMQRWRAQHPDTAGFHTLRTHARARDLAFTITFEEYCEAIAAFRSTGPELRNGDRISVDRIDPRRGYVPGNIQAMTLRENVIKGLRFRYSREGRYWASLEEAQRAEFRQSEDADIDLSETIPDDDWEPDSDLPF